MIAFAAVGLPMVLIMISPQPPDVWEFQGIEIHAKVGCVNNPSVEARHTWIRKGDGYQAERQALRDQLRQQHGPLFSVNTFSITTSKPRAIALVRKTLLCAQYNGPRKTVQSYRWHVGADREAVVRQLESDTRITPDVQSFEVVRWIDVAGELQKLGAASGGYREVVTRTYGPLEASFTSGSTRSGRTVVHIRATNTDRHNATLVQLTMNGRVAGKPVLLQPGETFSGPIEAVEGFGVQVQLKNPEDEKKEIIDLLKSLFRDEFTVKDGQVKRIGDGGSGVRG